MERVVFENSRGLHIIGDLYPSNSNSAVILSHGFTGDRHEWGKFDDLAVLLNKQGYTVLTFDFSGSGESSDDSITLDKEVDDLKQGIKFMRKRGFNNIGLIGLSLGGLVSVKAYDSKIKAIVLYAPVTAATPDYELKKWAEEDRKELARTGVITYIPEAGYRKKLIIDKQMVIDRETVNQREVLSKIRCPVLIIHGDADESVPIHDSEEAIRHVPKGSHLKIIKKDNHFDDTHFRNYFEPTIEWLKINLPIEK